MRYLACDKREGAFGQAHQARVGVAMGIINEVIHRHTRIGGDAERTAIGEANTKLTVWSGLNNVTSIDEIPNLGLRNVICR